MKSVLVWFWLIVFYKSAVRTYSCLNAQCKARPSLRSLRVISLKTARVFKLFLPHETKQTYKYLQVSSGSQENMLKHETTMLMLFGDQEGTSSAFWFSFIISVSMFYLLPSTALAFTRTSSTTYLTKGNSKFNFSWRRTLLNVSLKVQHSIAGSANFEKLETTPLQTARKIPLLPISKQKALPPFLFLLSRPQAFSAFVSQKRAIHQQHIPDYQELFVQHQSLSTACFFSYRIIRDFKI